MGTNNKSTKDKRALKNHLYQFELGGKGSDQQWASWPVKASDEIFISSKKRCTLSEMDRFKGMGGGIAGLMH